MDSSLRYVENRTEFEMSYQQKNGQMPALNERFGATAAGRAGLKCSAGKPLLRQAAPRNAPFFNR